MVTRKSCGKFALAACSFWLFALGAPVDAQLTCPSSPMSGCTGPVAVRGSLLSVKSTANPKQSRLQWRVSNADTTFEVQFGNPASGTTSYAVCIYDGGSLVYG